MYVLEMTDGEEMRISADEMNHRYGFLVFSNDGEEVYGVRAEMVRTWRFEEALRREAIVTRKGKAK